MLCSLSAGLRSHASPLLVAAGPGCRVDPAVSPKRLSGKGPPAAALAAVITGWGVGQYPWMLVDKVTIADAARAGAALAGLMVVIGLAGRHRAARARTSAVAHPHQGMDTPLNRFKDGASDALVAAGLSTCSRAARQVA